MLPLASLLTAALALQTPAGGGGQSTTPNVPYPIEETIEAADGDAEAILAKVVDGMGRDALAELERIGFTAEYWSWRGPKLAFYEKFRTKATLGDEPVGLVREATISPETGLSQDVRMVVNDDDRFYVQRRTVSSSAQAELMATHAYYNQLFLLLGPWLIERAGTEVIYDGISTLSSFTPETYQPPDDDGSGGYSGYELTDVRCHKLRAAMPESFRGAHGPEAELWISMGDEPRLVAVRSTVESRNFAYARMAPIYHVVSWQEVAGLTLPAVLDMSPVYDSERQERIVLSEVVPDVEILPEELRRP